jgi:serine/threonine protein phosphatase 1
MIDDVTVIGDVHGCYKTLMALLSKMPTKHKKRLCFAGDLIDRGPMSKEVVEFVMKNNHDCVMGNHEFMMANWSGSYSDMLWLGNGGDKALESYKLPADPIVPHIKGPINHAVFKDHQKWMADLPFLVMSPKVQIY